MNNIISKTVITLTFVESTDRLQSTELSQQEMS